MGLLAQRPLDVEVWPLSDEKRLEGKKLVVLVLPMSQILRDEEVSAHSASALWRPIHLCRHRQSGRSAVLSR